MQCLVLVFVLCVSFLNVRGFMGGGWVRKNFHVSMSQDAGEAFSDLTSKSLNKYEKVNEKKVEIATSAPEKKIENAVAELRVKSMDNPLQVKVPDECMSQGFYGLVLKMKNGSQNWFFEDEVS